MVDSMLRADSADVIRHMSKPDSEAYRAAGIDPASFVTPILAALDGYRPEPGSELLRTPPYGELDYYGVRLVAEGRPSLYLTFNFVQTQEGYVFSNLTRSIVQAYAGAKREYQPLSPPCRYRKCLQDMASKRIAIEPYFLPDEETAHVATVSEELTIRDRALRSAGVDPDQDCKAP